MKTVIFLHGQAGIFASIRSVHFSLKKMGEILTIEFEFRSNEGRFLYPEEPFQLLVDEFDEALDRRDCGQASEAAHIRKLECLIAKEPDFIDGHAHLGFALLEQGKPKKALQACLDGFSAGERVLPEGYAGHIEWDYLENRPFLRAMHGAVLCYLRLRRRKDAVALMEGMLTFNPNDNQGIRYLLGSEYLRLGRADEARPFFEKEAGHYPPYHYELALLELLKGDWIHAATNLRRGFYTNSYIAELLTGNPDPTPLAIWHGSNLSEPEIAKEYVSMHGDLWKQNPGYVAFVRWLFNHPMILRERATVFDCQEELLWVHDFERRRTIVEKLQAIETGIDDHLSKQITQPRLNRDGDTVFPWLPAVSMLPVL